MMFGIPLTATALKTSLIANALLALLLIGATAGWRSHAASLRDQVNTAQRDVGGAQANTASCAANNVGWELEFAEQSVSLATCQSQWEQEKLDGASAIALAQAGRAQADASLAAWRDSWKQLTSQCSVALSNMEQACTPELGDLTWPN